jgi:tetratricopeptide (TPR) repeat protein
MEYSPNQKETLSELLSEFEAMSQHGFNALLEENDFIRLIRYFENELQIDKAIDVIDYALEMFAYSVDFYTRKADLLLKVNKLEEAKNCIDYALSLAPLDLQACLLHVRYLSAKEQFTECMAILEDLLNQDMDKNIIPILFTKAEVLDNMGEYTLSYDTLTSILEMEPDNAEAMIQLWSCTEVLKCWQASIIFHKQLIDRLPYNAMAWYNLGLGYSCIGEYERAIDAFEYSFIIDKNFQEAYKDCADLCFELCRYRQALKIYLEAYDVFGADIDLFSNIGQCLIHLNKNKTARKYLTKALQLDPFNDELHYYVGVSFSREGRWVNAINAYRRALELDDCREEFLAGMGEAYFHLNEFEKADRYFRKAIKDGPEQSFIWLSYANFLIATDKIEKAVKILGKADFYAQSTDLLYCKSACLFMLDQKKVGLEVLREALISDYSLHGLLFTFAPYLQFDSDIQSIILYYKGQ